MRKHSILTVSDANSDIDTRKKMRSRNLLVAAAAFFADFSRNSSVHGVKYIGERRRHWSERMFWVIAFLISFLGCTMMIYKIYVKWQLSPVIVSFAEKSTPVWQIPFPAVTICPETKTSKSFIDFGKTYRKLLEMKANEQTVDEVLNKKDREYVEALAQICDPHIFTLSDIKLDNILKPENIISTLKKIQIPQNDSVLFCKWRNEVNMCSNFFDEIITEEGYCQSFNILDSGELLRIEK